MDTSHRLQNRFPEARRLALRAAGELFVYLPGGQFSSELPGARHLAGMIGGGLLGAGFGYRRFSVRCYAIAVV